MQDGAVTAHNQKIKDSCDYFGAKGRSMIRMVWVPPLEFDPYCEGKWLPL